MTLRKYMEGLLDEDTPEGDLARDVVGNDQWKRKRWTFESLEEHLIASHACDGAWNALKEIKTRYQAMRSQDSLTALEEIATQARVSG